MLARLIPLLVTALVSVTSCDGVSNRSRAETTTTADSARRVRVGYLVFTATLPFFIAEEKGFFAQEGLVVVSEAVATSNLLVNALAAGAIDMLPASSAAPILALEAASPGRVRIISASIVDESHPFDAILLPARSDVRSLADLAGKRIGVFPGTTAASLLRKFLADKGVDTSRMTFVPLPPNAQLTALAQGAIDALHSYEPITTTALLRPDVRRLYGSVYAEQLSPNPQGVAAMSAAFVQRDPEAARRVVRALDRALVFVQAQPDSAREVMRRRIRLDSAVAERAAIPYMVTHDRIDADALQRYADMLYELKELPRRIDARALVYRDAPR